MPRDEILSRYRHLRAISKQHNQAAMRFLSQQTILDHARALGLAAGKTIMAENDAEMALVLDLAIHAPRRCARARSTANDK